MRRGPGSIRIRSMCGLDERLYGLPGRMNVSAWLTPLLVGLLAAAPVAASQEQLAVDGQTVTIQRDRYGVPHIFAPTERAAYWADGYAIAEDRMAQMEKYRRAAR